MSKKASKKASEKRLSKKTEVAESLTAEYISDEIERYGRDSRRKESTRWNIFLLVLVVAIIIAVFKLPVIRIYGSSMKPTFVHGDIVIPVKDDDIKQGDIIAFQYNSNYLVKRVIALEGDIVDIKVDGTVYINGEEYDEPYITAKALGVCNIQLPYEVPYGCYFVMGDYRPGSEDSRSKEIGPVPQEKIVGKIKLCLWGLGRIGKVQ